VAGWKKKGHNRRAWKRRWFVLSDAKFTSTMAYFESDFNGGTNKKGEIPLSQCSVERLDRKKHPNSFVIHTKASDKQPTDYILAADKPEETEGWIRAINTAIKATEEEQKRLTITPIIK